MNKTKYIFLFLFVFLIASVIIVVIMNLNKKELAELSVSANVSATVIVNGREVGKTPYIDIWTPQEVVVKILNYETRVFLEPGIKTIIDRQFDANKISSSGKLVYFEKNFTNSANLSIVTSPASVVVLDGKNVGTSPIKMNGLKEGIHKLEDFSVNLVPGYDLIAIIDLPKTISNNQNIQPITESQVAVKDSIKILSTPTGFLRVRSEPSIASDEVTVVYPGEIYQLQEIDQKTGWFDIAIDASSSGWISNIYAATVSGQTKK